MVLRKVFFIVCLAVSVLCLAVGYAVAGQWTGAVIAGLIAPVWLLARKYPASVLPLFCLLASVCVAAVGQLTGSPPWSMILGSGIALAAWDLLLLDAALGKRATGEQTRQYENKHLQSLVLALGSGLLAACLGRLVTLRIPFILLVLLVALVVFGLNLVWDYVKKERTNT